MLKSALFSLKNHKNCSESGAPRPDPCISPASLRTNSRLCA